jgi:Spx/MgsR family transcriptional regulator
MIVFGLPNCDSCRKARTVLMAAGRTATFRDVRAAPLSELELQEMLAAFGDRLINRASTTWRSLSDDERSEAPATLLSRHPTLLKRPVIRDGRTLLLGWTDATRAQLGIE